MRDEPKPQISTSLRISPENDQKLRNMVKHGEARSLSEAMNIILEKYFAQRGI